MKLDKSIIMRIEIMEQEGSNFTNTNIGGNDEDSIS